MPWAAPVTMILRSDSFMPAPIPRVVAAQQYAAVQQSGSGVAGALRECAGGAAARSAATAHRIVEPGLDAVLPVQVRAGRVTRLGAVDIPVAAQQRADAGWGRVVARVARLDR